MLLDGNDPGAIQRAAARLAAGELVAFPTETVYGLGARADDDKAVVRIFQAKGRPSDHPLIVHLADEDAATDFASDISDLARRLMRAFWPGPLTVIVPRAAGAGRVAAGGQATIGLRCPSHPVALALLRAARAQGVPGVAAPSANRFGRVSPTTAAHVRAEFGADLWVVNGGACEVGIESSIVDCSGGRPVLLRPGHLTRAQIESAAGQPLGEAGQTSPRAPGTLAAHYAPRARLRLMSTETLQSALDLLGESPLRLAVYSRSPGLRVPPGVRRQRMATDPQGAAHELFATLRALDDEGIELIWVEQPPATPEWEGVCDRLNRAAAT